MVPVREWPLWVRYVIAFTVAAAIVVVLVIEVNGHQAESEGLPATASRSELAQEVNQDTTLMRQQQRPRVTQLAGGLSASAAASQAVTRWMGVQTKKAFISGPLDSSARCIGTGGSSARAAFRCRIVAGPKGTRLKYPFDVVVATASSGAKVTFCQVVTAPLPSIKEPAISSRCR